MSCVGHTECGESSFQMSCAPSVGHQKPTCWRQPVKHWHAVWHTAVLPVCLQEVTWKAWTCTGADGVSTAMVHILNLSALSLGARHGHVGPRSAHG